MSETLLGQWLAVEGGGLSTRLAVLLASGRRRCRNLIRVVYRPGKIYLGEFFREYRRWSGASRRVRGLRPNDPRASSRIVGVGNAVRIIHSWVPIKLAGTPCYERRALQRLPLTKSQTAP